MQSSAVRDILKVVQAGQVISLAGGIPAPQSFPLDRMGDLFAQVMTRYGANALQYDASEGFAPLREALADHVAAKGISATASDVLVFSGSQGVLDALGKVLISPGDCIAVESPTYLGALSAFNPYEPRYLSLATDDHGLIPEALDETLRHHPVKFIYSVPTFQNPTGRTIPLARRQQIAALLQEHNALLVEDDPYGDLRYRGEAVPPLYSLAPTHVVYVSSLSKIFAPGLRIGFTLAPAWLREWLVIARQGVDLHTSTLNQALAAEYLAGGYLAQQLPQIIELYRPRQLTLLQALDRHLPENFSWSEPEGGMFVWVQGPKGLDSEQLYWRAVERGVAFVPGHYFYANAGEAGSDAQRATMRLNFTMADEAALDRAVALLAQTIIESQTLEEA